MSDDGDAQQPGRDMQTEVIAIGLMSLGYNGLVDAVLRALRMQREQCSGESMGCVSKLSTPTDATGPDEGHQTTDPGVHHTLLPWIEGDETATKSNIYTNVLITLSIRKGSQLLKR